MNTRHQIALVIGVALALGAVGCADSDGETQAAANVETEQSAAAGDTAYLGSWGANLTVDQASDKGDGRLAGDFTLTLNDDGTYSMSNSFDPEATGRYEAKSGNRLAFKQDSGCDMNFKGVGVYSWKVEDDQLTIKNVVPESGGCTGRTDTLTFPDWQRR